MARLIDSEIVCTVSVVPPCWREVGAVAQGVTDCGRLAGIQGVRSGLSRLSSLTPTNTYAPAPTCTQLEVASTGLLERSYGRQIFSHEPWSFCVTSARRDPPTIMNAPSSDRGREVEAFSTAGGY